jgi:hypothetical protein
MFNPKSIRGVLAETARSGVTLVKVSTSNAMFFGIFHGSFHSPFWRMTVLGKMFRHLSAYLVFPVAYLVNSLRGDLGEEIYLIAEKDAQK